MLKKYQNESKNDRIIRFILGIILGVISYTMLTGIIQVIIYAIAIVLIFTAISGFCLIYKMFKINTIKN